MDNDYELITIPEEDNPSESRSQTPDSLPALEDMTYPESRKLEDGMQAIYDNINKLLEEYGQTGLDECGVDKSAQGDCLQSPTRQGDCLQSPTRQGDCLQSPTNPHGSEPIDYVLDDIRTGMRADGIDPKTAEITRAYLDKVCEDLRLHYDIYYGKYKSLNMPRLDGTVYWLDSIIQSIHNPSLKLTVASQRALCRDILKRIHTKGAELTYIELVSEDGRVGYEPVTGCAISEQTHGIMELCAYVKAWLDTNPDYLIWL
jgi:hypothetical protein